MALVLSKKFSRARQSDYMQRYRTQFEEYKYKMH